MSDEPRTTASAGYALAQLQRATEAATNAPDRSAQQRAEAKAAAWQAVLDGMTGGGLTVGSRTPVDGTPDWVTLEVVHGGFATGRYVAETPLDDTEQAMLAAGATRDIAADTERERLNLWFLGDDGQSWLRAALRGETYAVDVPEHAAFLVLAWLVDRGHAHAAMLLATELQPWFGRLRFAPRLRTAAQPAGAVAHVATAGEVADALREAEVRPQYAAMRETLRVWNPLYDRLVALWCDTVDGELPHLADGRVAGGWPCRTWPADWAERRARWLADYTFAAAANTASTRHRHPRANFARLRAALEACENDSAALSPRDVGWVRRALANTVTKHGAPGAEPRAALRAIQAAAAARRPYAELARALAAGLDAYPRDGGIGSVDAVVERLGEPVPAHLVAKVARALDAPVDELIERGIVPSNEVLAKVLPQVTAPIVAGGIADRELAGVYAAAYAAFRRRRSLLLLNLEHQVRFEELPWIRVLEPFRTPAAAGAARQALEQAVLLALIAFPYEILPNPLVRELGALATQAGVRAPLVEEVAADIFEGTFTAKWRDAATVACEVMAGTLYARYYDLPPAGAWDVPKYRVWRWGKETADEFTVLCVRRAREAHHDVDDGWRTAVPRNGTIVEQSQILTTHNLAVLVGALGLEDRVRAVAPELAARTFAWIARQRAQVVAHPVVALRAVKNAAYAWRQAIFFLSFCTDDEQRAAVAALAPLLTGPRGLPEAVEGLAYVVAGGSFTDDGLVPGGRGRRLLGWTVGPHWATAGILEGAGGR